MTPHAIIWRDPNGKVIACIEKNRVMQDNLAEIRQIAQDALEDAVLMGCDAQQVRQVLSDIMLALVNPYKDAS